MVDQQSLALPGVRIELHTEDGARVEVAITRGDGSFAIDVAPGTYSLTAHLDGFEPVERAVTVTSEGVVVDLLMAIRPFEQTLPVTAALPEMATEQVVPSRQVEQRVAQDLALSLREQAGVTALRRGQVNLDPSVRGLYAEQIGVFVDGTRTFAAGPARMDSELSHVSPHALQSMRVVRGPFALTWGAGTLSAIRVETFKPDFRADGFRFGGRAGFNYGSNGATKDGYGSFWGSSERFRFTLQHNTRAGDDYTDGNGEAVPGGYESFDTQWSVGGHLTEDTLLEYSGGHQQQNDLEYPGRILDATFFTTNSHAVELTHAPDEGLVREVVAQAYRNAKDHRMNNDDKPTAMDMPGRRPPFALDVDLPAEATTTGGRFHVAMGRGALRSRIGGDIYRLDQTATRTISRRSNDMVLFSDRVWPDARVSNAGAYAQLVRRFASATLGGTVRLDHERADVGEVSPYFRDNASPDLSQRNTNLSAAASLSWNVRPGVVVNLGAGRAVRNPSALERYSDRFPAVKFQTAAEFMGSPELTPEKSRELNAGAVIVYRDLVVEADVFHRVIDDYITVAPDPTLTKRLPLSPPVVFRYVQGGQARYIGGDLRVQIFVNSWLTAHNTVSYVQGDDTRFDEPLFGLPGLENRFGLRADAPGRNVWAELVVASQAEQDRVAAQRFEVSTKGWTTIDLNAGFALRDGMEIRAGVQNLTNAFYANHLNSFNPFTRLRIAEVGRSVYAGVTVGF